MSGRTIDYDALARKAGAISSTAPEVDYDALAKQAGATSSQPAPQSQDWITRGLSQPLKPKDMSKNAPRKDLSNTVRFNTPRQNSAQAFDTLGGVIAAPAQALGAPPTPEEMAFTAGMNPQQAQVLLAFKRMFFDPQATQWQKANETTGAESAGHRAAALIPVAGPMAAASGESFANGEPTAGMLNAYGAVAAGHGSAPAVERGVKVVIDNAPKVASAVVDAVPSPRGAMAMRMAEVPPGEQFSRGEVLQAARDNGVNLDVAQATDSGVAHAAKKANRYSLASQGTYDAATQKNVTALEQWADRQLTDYAPNGAGREVVGGQMQAALKAHLEARKNLAKTAFDELDSAVGSNSVDVSGTVQDAARKIVSENKGYYAEHPELKPSKAWNILEDLAKQPTKETSVMSGEVMDASGNPIKTGTQRVPVTKTMSWSELHQLRSDLMDFYRNNPDVVKGRADAWIQQMVGKADEALTQSAQGLTGEQLAKFRNANQIWESIKSTYDNPQSPYYHAVRAQYASQVPGMLAKATPELARQVRDTLGSLEGDFQRQFVETILTDKSGNLDLKNLNSRLSRIPNDHLEAMLGAKGARNLRLLGKVAVKVTGDMNPSGTAKVGVPAAEIGGVFTNPVSALSELGAQYVGAKAMNSPKVVDYLTKPKP